MSQSAEPQVDGFYTMYMYGLLGMFAITLASKYMPKKGGGTVSSSGEEGGVQHGSAAFTSFQRLFLFVYLIMMAADWMQGPYVYRLYEHYGFSREDNGILFIAGFGSSLVFGTWAGPLADKYGRKLNCMLYGVTYALSCFTKHFNNFSVLMLGRLLGGISTSILWSAFESWMVSEHLGKFDPSWLGGTFSLMITLNGLVAIGSGFVAQWAVDIVGHPVAPFDVSAAFLILGTVVIYFSWTENHGKVENNMMEQMKEGIQLIREKKSVLFVGLSQSLFEGAMYTFVFMWSPALAGEGSNRKPIPYGIIFASFMISSSLGGTLFGVLESKMNLPALMRTVFLTAAGMMAVPMITTDSSLIMLAFLGFEICVGMFWPSIGTLRAQHVPEQARATIANLFRVPLNMIVCVVLVYQGGMNVSSVFSFCTIFHLGAAVAAHMLSLQPVEAPAVAATAGEE